MDASRDRGRTLTITLSTRRLEAVMIAAVTTVKNESCIIGCTVRNMLEQGVDHVWVMDWGSTDGTQDVLRDIGHVSVLTGNGTFYWSQQPDYIYMMSNMAGEAGADWVIPFDADEYWAGMWNGTRRPTIAESLSLVTESHVYAPIVQYPD